MHGTSSSSAPWRRGAVAVQVTVCLTALVSVAAVAVDGGLVMAERRHAQAVADAAAQSAAADLAGHWFSNQGNDTGGTAVTSAQTTAADNGYTSSNATVTVNVPGNTYQGGPNAGTTIPAGYVEVIVQHNQPAYFAALWGTKQVPVSARAVARGKLAPGGNGFLVLAGSGQAVSMSGTANIQVPNGTFVVDSSGPKVFNDSSSVKSTASAFDFVSSQANLGISNPSSEFSGPSGTAPTLNYSQNVAPDPLLNLPTPSTTGLTAQNTSPGPWKPSGSSGTYTINPGIYYGGISVSGSANVVLNPGIYYLEGPLTWNSSGTLSSGTQGGVTGNFIYVAPGSSNKGISITSGGLNLSPMTTGTYQGIVLFQDRTSTASVELDGGASWTVSGTIYAADAPLTLTGPSSGTTIGSQIIANTVTVSGSATIDVTGNGNSSAPQVPVVQLVQ